MAIVLADDHERERVWVGDLLRQNFPNLLPVHEATNGREAVDLALRHKPELSFLDIEMPSMSGIRCAEEILKTLPQTGIIILSNHADEAWVRQLWKVMPATGAFAYVLKDASDDQIVQAAQAVLAGDCWIHPRIQRILLKNSAPNSTLTDAEFEVLAYICLGLTDKAIAKRIYLTDKAIQARLKLLYTKLDLPLRGTNPDDEYNHRCRAVNVALRRGLINKTQLEEWEEKLLSS